jgi:hypothetical protein
MKIKTGITGQNTFSGFSTVNAPASAPEYETNDKINKSLSFNGNLQQVFHH